MSVPYARPLFRLVVASVMTASVLLTAGAQDVRVRVSPSVLVPLADTGTYGVGGGGSFVMDMDLLGFIAPYLGGDLSYVSMTAEDFEGSLTLATGGAGLGFFMFPLPRLKLAASGGSGVYVGSYTDPERESAMVGNVFWRAGAELGYRFSPSFTLSAGASYLDLL